MPFHQKTRRGNFGKTNPKTLIPAGNRPEGWDRRLSGEDIPLNPPVSAAGHNFDRQKKIAAAVGITLMFGPFAFMLLGGGNRFHRGSEGCVDEKGVVVDDWNCRTTRSGHFYRRHYGGNYRVGSTPVGGTYTAPETGSSVRGIFGSIGHSFGAGG